MFRYTYRTNVPRVQIFAVYIQNIYVQVKYTVFSPRQYDVHAECDIRLPIPSVRPFADLSVQYQPV